MNYKKIYDLLIKKRTENILSDDVYFEVHHIVPKCVGGEDIDDNLVRLTPKEHFVAHRLLTKIYSYKGIRYAYNMMVFTTIDALKKYSNKISTKRYYRVSSREYNDCRQWLSKEASEFFKGKVYINNGEIQKVVDKEEAKDFVLNGWEYGKLPFSEEALASIREHAKNRILSEETHNKKSSSMFGEKNPAFGTKMMNKDGTNKRIPIDKINEYIKNGWKVGMLRHSNVKENTKNNKKNVTAGRFYVHLEKYPFLIRFARQEEYDYYINVLGWSPNAGKHRKECKEYTSKYGINKTWVFKPDPYEKRRIPNELKDFYLENGWQEGQGHYYKSSYTDHLGQ